PGIFHLESKVEQQQKQIQEQRAQQERRQESQKKQQQIDDVGQGGCGDGDF
ncbi:unnamed protein product, partial [Didymodactylos carnosus]